MSLTVWLEFRLPATPVILLIAYSFILEEPNWHDSAYFDFTLFIVNFGLIYCTYWCLIVLTLISSPRGLRGALPELSVWGEIKVWAKCPSNAEGYPCFKGSAPPELRGESVCVLGWPMPCHIGFSGSQPQSTRLDYYVSSPFMCRDPAPLSRWLLFEFDQGWCSWGWSLPHSAKRRIHVNLGDLKEIHDIFCCTATFMCSMI